MKRMKLLTLAWLASCGIGCAEPVYNDDIGLSGVPTESGALAGAFGLVSTAADLAQLPGLGDQIAGGMTFLLVERAWDGEAYLQTNRVCRVENFDVAGLHTEVSRTTARSIPALDVTIHVDHATGAVSTEKAAELWALQDIGLDDDLPTSADDARVWDMDGDDKLGATITASGLVDGELYFAQRKTISFDGVVRGPDEMLGLVTHKKEAVVLDATSDFLKQNASRHQHPDPKESWWHEVRLAPAGEGADCDDVEAAVDDETLSRLRPF
jgi:hypothetical protein